MRLQPDFAFNPTDTDQGAGHGTTSGMYHPENAQERCGWKREPEESREQRKEEKLMTKKWTASATYEYAAFVMTVNDEMTKRTKDGHVAIIRSI